MDIEKLREYCLSLGNTEEAMPFGDDTLVFKVGGKMFLLTNLVGELWINIKCDPEEAIDMREAFPAVSPGFHMNKRHWNTVAVDGSISDSMLEVWILKSYHLVLKSLSSKEREAFGIR